MTRTDLIYLLKLAETTGVDAALDALANDEAEAVAETRAAERQAEMECDDRRYVFGAGEFDSRDSRGRKLRPAVNEAGEPWWMC